MPTFFIFLTAEAEEEMIVLSESTEQIASKHWREG